jgi:NitT/TauT family transport system substrate-binding protein
MNCCQETKLDLVLGGPNPDGLSRRTMVKAAAGLAGLSLAAVSGANAQSGLRRIKLAFCSQLLCIVPYEVTRAANLFADEGLEVELVYTRGGNAAMQALVGGAVDYAATSFDVAVQAFANGAGIRRFATTGRLPLFALAVAPDQSQDITTIKDLEGKTVGISGLGNADHTLLLFLLTQAGADSGTVEFAALGPNMFEALRRGQVAAGMVQEPALTLIAADGGRVLFNAMDLADAEQRLGGPYEFMGVAYRSEEREERLEEMQALARALEAGLKRQRTVPVAELREAVPSELLVGGEGERFDQIISQYREAIYPETVAIDVEACQRVVDALKQSGALKTDVDLSVLLDTDVVPG